MASSACTFSSDDIVIKSPNDSRLYRLIELENGLQALLVHDPEIYPDGPPKSLENGHEIDEDLDEEEEEEDEDEEEEDDDGEEEEEEEDHEVKGKEVLPLRLKRLVFVFYSRIWQYPVDIGI